ncbi:glycoside hydrolase family 125 protein [Microlunatus sp. Gsoil 973]|uniref:glycoside hydrolase family 125 protein n=1 Tax=Microlunatus sp. Gsoil 973 TaxID=2672569 RepID=UPI0012B4517D|nr:glycoside hydrolase family 125 protein [Microlunatus sp. Gsoil 973]QGN34746.1 metal-independent alpha-mannosidase [Microlunatus sp. Gsoil 973]
MHRHPSAGIDPVLLSQLSKQVDAAIGDPDVTAMFTRVMSENLPAVAELASDGTTYLLTGDIPAMWLRDSAAQVRPYLIVCDRDPALAETLIGVFRRQVDFVTVDPYANSFKRGTEPSPHAEDRSGAGPRVWERKYEIDSLCFPLDLGHALWRITGRTDHLDERFAVAARTILDLWECELDHEKSPYFFERDHHLPTETLSRNGRGEPVGRTGMSWSAFRPSDDACVYNYNVPGNMFAAVVLGQLEVIAKEVLGDTEIAGRAATLRASISDGIETYGVVDHPTHGRVYCYETDGLGHHLIMDDANMPSLLSLPLSGYLPADDPTYLATRRLILSPENPYFYSGRCAEGIGSPHTKPNYVWPIALAVQGLTATDGDEKRRVLRLLVDTTGGTGQMHESFDVDDPTRFSRPWFSWANAMMCELVLDLAGVRLAELVATS